MRCLIVGGTGFLGGWVSIAFAKAGHTVVAFNRHIHRQVLEVALDREQLARITFVEGDVIDAAHLLATARKHRIDTVVHLAFIMGKQSQENPVQAIRTNIEGCNNVFNTAGAIGARRLVWSSSISVFGPSSIGPDGTVPNDAKYDPQNVYGACKVVNELASLHYAHDHKLATTCFRFPSMYGPGSVRGYTRWVTDLIENLVNGKPGIAPRGDRELTWLYVEDAAEAMLMAAQSPSTPTMAYNTGGDVLSERQVSDMVAEMFPFATIDILKEETPKLIQRFDDSLVRTEMGWKPRHSMKQGVKACMDFYRRAT